MTLYAMFIVVPLFHAKNMFSKRENPKQEINVTHDKSEVFPNHMV